ncbi:hypothetical protein [Actinopolyspora mzabensis]|uniref:hypothetical protein n=1 Tax=Actinopolyspora mzabensis TaxID=995066 RepID=UPI000B820C3F|nr:hypothetical protein [Actinopolyspora mzabensis]
MIVADHARQSATELEKVNECGTRGTTALLAARIGTDWFQAFACSDCTEFRITEYSGTGSAAGSDNESTPQTAATTRDFPASLDSALLL